jgi:hypothetical protein
MTVIMDNKIIPITARAFNLFRVGESSISLSLSARPHALKKAPHL